MRLAISTTMIFIAAFASIAVTQAQEMRLSLRQRFAMQKMMDAAIKPCVPPGAPTKTPPSAALRLTFNLDSSLARPPQLISSNNVEWGLAALRGVNRCLARPGAITFDKKYYSVWRTIDLHVQPLHPGAGGDAGNP